jgi:chromate reductase
MTVGRILLISGSTRAGATNTLALRALSEHALYVVETEQYQGLSRIPAFTPDLDPLPTEVDELLACISRANAVVFATPEYAGGLPGSLKNLLDWTVGGGQLYDKLIAWLDVANPGRGGGARGQLRTVLGYVGARVVEAACVHVNLDRNGGAVTLGDGAEHQLRQAISALVSAIDEDKRERAAAS